MPILVSFYFRVSNFLPATYATYANDLVAAHIMCVTTVLFIQVKYVLPVVQNICCFWIPTSQTFWMWTINILKTHLDWQLEIHFTSNLFFLECHASTWLLWPKLSCRPYHYFKSECWILKLFFITFVRNFGHNMYRFRCCFLNHMWAVLQRNTWFLVQILPSCELWCYQRGDLLHSFSI
jgi:hypothetical protein